VNELVAVVPAFNCADTVGDTVTALMGVADMSRVVVVDDGSTDATAQAASEAGAELVKLTVNVGKGSAVMAGLERCRSAEIVLLIDADTGHTAAEAVHLVGPVAAGDVEMTVAVLPSVGRRAGFGFVKGIAHEALLGATGQPFAAPLSGQRAVRMSILDDIQLAPRFGLEVGLTIDVHRAGGSIREVKAGFDHRHTGRSLAGFVHRFGQGRDLVKALRARVGTRATVAAVVASVWSRVRR
jgi:glycosyltransferase involved in cell wall biosynthesis